MILITSMTSQFRHYIIGRVAAVAVLPFWCIDKLMNFPRTIIASLQDSRKSSGLG